MAGWHHGLNEHDFEQTLGHHKGEGRLACCSSWGYKELDTMEEQLPYHYPQFVLSLGKISTHSQVYILSAKYFPPSLSFLMESGGPSNSISSSQKISPLSQEMDEKVSPRHPSSTRKKVN